MEKVAPFVVVLHRSKPPSCLTHNPLPISRQPLPPTSRKRMLALSFLDNKRHRSSQILPFDLIFFFIVSVYLRMLYMTVYHVDMYREYLLSMPTRVKSISYIFLFGSDWNNWNKPITNNAFEIESQRIGFPSRCIRTYEHIYIITQTYTYRYTITHEREKANVFFAFLSLAKDPAVPRVLIFLFLYRNWDMVTRKEEH